jgi:ABC transporter substrate binding protein
MPYSEVRGGSDSLRLTGYRPYIRSGNFADAGGLVVYATNFEDLFRQAADYIDRVLKGAQPGELPVQQAATFELLANLKTAVALSLTIPPLTWAEPTKQLSEWLGGDLSRSAPAFGTGRRGTEGSNPRSSSTESFSTVARELSRETPLSRRPVRGRRPSVICAHRTRG